MPVITSAPVIQEAAALLATANTFSVGGQFIQSSDSGATGSPIAFRIKGASAGSSAEILLAIDRNDGVRILTIDNEGRIMAPLTNKGFYCDRISTYTGAAISVAADLALGARYHELSEMTAPSAPAANGVRIYAEDNGAGKTRLMALFATGAAQQIAIEP